MHVLYSVLLRSQILKLFEESHVFIPFVLFKDIVQPKKRGVKRVTNRFVLPSYTIADILFEHLKGYSHALNLKKPVSAFRAKKMWSLF